MKRQVIALTEPGDEHLDLVQPYLNDEILVIGQRSSLQKHELSFEVTQSGRTYTTFKGKRLHVGSVWYRKPRPIRPEELHVPDGFKDYVIETQQRHYLHLRGAFPKALWVSDVYAINRTENKLFQLSLAKKCGFRIPDTLLTSDKERALDFIRTNGQCIVKSLARHFPLIDSKQAYFFAQKIDEQSLPNLNGLYLAPAIFQQAIEASYDVRVAVVDNQAFGSIVTNNELPESNVRDWRVGHSEGTVQFDALTLPREIADRCIRYTRQAGLLFSAFDFVVDTKGGYWFIEDNPNGQWGFVESATREAIAKALARLLSRQA